MHEKEIENLQAEKEKVERQLAQEQRKIQRLENRAAYYEKGERRKRAHRLITRGAAIESVAPQTKELSETAFYAFAEKVRYSFSAQALTTCAGKSTTRSPEKIYGSYYHRRRYRSGLRPPADPLSVHHTYYNGTETGKACLRSVINDSITTAGPPAS